MNNAMEYCYIDYLYKEIGLKAEDIEAVPEMGRADDACDEIARKEYVVEQFKDISFGELKYAVCCLCDSPEVNTRHDALMFLVWIAALNIKEENAMT